MGWRMSKCSGMLESAPCDLQEASGEGRVHWVERLFWQAQDGGELEASVSAAWRRHA